MILHKICSERGFIVRKKERQALYVQQYENLFHCPICQERMHVVELRSLVCTQNHTFDFAKQGYLNFLTKPPKTKYDRELFEARHILMDSGQFFAPVLGKIAEIISENCTQLQEELIILDAGCGEGTHLYTLCQEYLPKEKKVVGAGIDIAKEGILVAAKYFDHFIWCVADLANSPFRDQTFHVILNILSPANYEEFHRLLKQKGLLVKVVPTGDYLKEIRQILFTAPEKQTYSNEAVVEHFQESFQLIDRKRVEYTTDLQGEYLNALVQMTPLTWSVSQERIKRILQEKELIVTVSLEILIGRKG